MPSAKKIAVAGATGRVGHHVTDILTERGRDVVPMSRSQGVDVITGDGLAAALAGVECVIDAVAGPSPEQRAATAFFTTAARNLHQAGQRAGVRRMIVVSVIGTDRFTAGYGPAKIAHEQAHAGRDPSRCGCCAPRSSTSSSPSWWTGALKGDIAYVPRMRTQLVAARAVAEVLADLVTGSGPAQAPFIEVAGPREESMVEMAELLAARRGHPGKIEGVSDPADPGRELNENGALLPGSGAILTGPTFEGWLDSAP